MVVYLITFLFFIVFSFIEVRTNVAINVKRKMYFFLFIWVVFLIGTRWETGTDWADYFRHFLESTSYQIVLFNVLVGYEIGYGLFAFTVRSFTDNYSIFLVIHALVYYHFIFKANKVLSPLPFVSLLILFASTMGIVGSNKQLIAIAICLYSLKFLLEKKMIKFFLCVLIAFFFHTSALLFLVYFFLNKDFKKYYVVLALVLAIIIGKSSLPNMLFDTLSGYLGGAVADKAEMYSENKMSETTLSLVGLLRRLLFFFIFFINYDKIVKKFPTYRVLFNGFTFGLIIYFMFSNSFVILVGRGSFYFNTMECFLMASQLLLFPSKKERAYLLVLFFCYAYFIFHQSISEYPQLFFPYKGLFINESFTRNFTN